MSEPHPATWNILELLRWTTGYFEEKGVLEPRASAEILLAHTLGSSRLDLYLRHDQPLTPEELASFKLLIMRRRLGEPVAYLTGHKEFWSLDFLVTPAVLIPRPETEVLVEEVLKVFRGGGQGFSQVRTPVPLTPAHSPTPPPPTPNFGSTGFQPVQHRQDACAPGQRGLGGEFEGRAGDLQSPGPPFKSLLALDLGVGSGAVVVALAKELPEVVWVAVDVSAAALEVARENARRHDVAARIRFLQGNLLTGVRPGPWFSLIAANPPYVSQAEWEELPEDIREHEPREALLGGEDGLALLGPLAREAHHFLQPGGWLALEVGAGQAGMLMELLGRTKAYTTVKDVPDYQGIPRVVLARRRESD